jgi:hypothetical protein
MCWGFGGHTFYETLRDLGGLIGSVIALAAAAVAYCAGRMQVTATTRASDAHISALNAEAKRESDAIVLSLAVEIRETLAVVVRLHEVLKGFIDRETPVDPISLKRFTRLPKPTVYEAAADKIGLLGSALARKIASFFTATDRIGVTVDLMANVPPDAAVEDNLLRALLALIEQKCRESLPLLDALPRDEDDAGIRMKIEAMSKA